MLEFPVRSFAPSRLATAMTLSAAALIAMGLIGCAPSINPAAKADIDKRISSLQAPSKAVPTPGKNEFTPMPMAAGQWTQYKMVDDKNEPSFLTYKVLGEQDGADWIEIVMDTYHGKTIQKMLVFFGSRTDPKQVEIRSVTTKDSRGHVTELPPTVMPMMQSLYRNAVSSLIIEWKGQPQEAAEAPAGRFGGCFKAHSKAQWGPWQSEADTWSHPAIPINGLVRSVGTDKKFSMELVAYGMSGAVSDL